MKNLPLDNFKYKGDGYTFVFANPREGFYKTLIVRPRHLKVLRNDTEMTTEQLKDSVIAEWFAEENEQVRIDNNAKRRAKAVK